MQASNLDPKLMSRMVKIRPVDENITQLLWVISYPKLGFEATKFLKFYWAFISTKVDSPRKQF